MKRASTKGALAATGLAVLVTLIALALGGGNDALAKGKKGGTCKLGALDGYFKAGEGKAKTRRAGCGDAQAVAKTFAAKCFGAYAGQGKCKVRSRGKWSCKSRMTGEMAGGAPARVKCRKGKARVSFLVGYFPPTEPSLSPEPAKVRRAVSPAWRGSCIDTNLEGTDVPPPTNANFFVRVVGNAPAAKGTLVQETLIQTDAWQKITTGLSGRPRVHPGRLPIIVTSGRVPGNAYGVQAPSCHDDSWDAVLIGANFTAREIRETAVHELFHAVSSGATVAAGGALGDTWWEEASATWSQGHVGLAEDRTYDNMLQFPVTPLDKFQDGGTWQYAMSRFVQFLDSNGFIRNGAAWPVHRLIASKNPAATTWLDEALKNQGTNIGDQVAAFWGDRIRRTPLHGPQLRVGGEGTTEIEIDPLVVDFGTKADRLSTKMIQLKLTDDISRIELEFEEPPGGHFWVGVEENLSVPVADGESLSFCVNGQGVDERPWPGKLPMTFTNGKLTEGKITGKVTVNAQRNAEQCTGGGGNSNRACSTLAEAGVEGMFGPGQFPFSSSSSDQNQRMWLCFYVGDRGEVQHNLVHHRTATARQVRQIGRRQIRELGLNEINNVGDLAGVGTIVDDEGKAADALLAVSGRETIFLLAAPTNEARTIRLAKRVVGQVE
jgi:hypothetical protein